MIIVAVSTAIFIAGFMACTMIGLTKAESYKIQLESLGLVIQAINTPRK